MTNHKRGILSFSGRVRDYRFNTAVNDLVDDLYNRDISKVEAIRDYVVSNMTLEEKKELADELDAEVMNEASIRGLCLECLTELEVAESVFEDRGVVHGAPATEEVITAMECPACGRRWGA